MKGSFIKTKAVSSVVASVILGAVFCVAGLLGASMNQANAANGNAAIWCDSLRFDFNTATAEQLKQISGIGDARANSIIASRPFVSAQDLVNRVSGVTTNTLNNGCGSVIDYPAKPSALQILNLIAGNVDITGKYVDTKKLQLFVNKDGLGDWTPRFYKVTHDGVSKTVAQGSYYWDVTTSGRDQLAPWEDGEYQYQVCFRKPATNDCLTEWSDPVAVIYDGTAPTLAGVTANGREVKIDGTTKVSNQGDTIFTITTNDGAGAGVLRIYLAANGSFWSAKNANGEVLTFTIPAGTLVDGQTYTFNISTRDKAQNTGNAASYKVSFTVDNTSPTMKLVENAGAPSWAETPILDGSVIGNAGKNVRIDKDKTDVLYGNFNGGAFSQIAGQVTTYDSKPSIDWWFDRNGDGVYTFYTEDTAGNKSAVYTITIDTLGPDVVITHLNDLAIGDLLYTKENTLKVTGTAFDLNLKDYNLRIYNSGKTAQVSPNIPYTGKTSVTDGILANLNIAGLSDGLYNVRIWADDLAGHRAGINQHIYVPFVVDRTAPTLGQVIANNSTVITDGAVLYLPAYTEFLWEASDANGVKYAAMKLTKNGQVVAQNTKTGDDVDGYVDINGLDDGDYILYIEALDAAGNYIDYRIAFRVDTTAPIGNVTYAPDTWTSGNVVATLSVNEPVATPDGWTKVSAIEFTKTFNANGSEVVTLTDIAGNSVDVNVEVTWIDQDPPVIIDTVLSTTEWADEVTLTIDASDFGIGLDAVAYSIDGGNTWHASNQFRITANGTYAIAVRDALGNVVTSSVTVTNIRPVLTPDPNIPTSPYNPGDDRATGGVLSPTNTITYDTGTITRAGTTDTDDETTTPAQPAAETATTTYSADKTLKDSGEVLGDEDKPVWSLTNLLLAVATVIIGVAATIAHFVRKRGEETSRGVAIAVGVAAAVGAVITFFATENMALPMAWFDQWTILMVGLAVVSIVATAVALRGSGESEK